MQRKALIIIGAMLMISFSFQILANYDEKGNAFYLNIGLFVVSLILNIYHIYTYINEKKTDTQRQERC